MESDLRKTGNRGSGIDSAGHREARGLKNGDNGVRTQTNQVHQELRQRIIEGVYRPSETLTELSLASAFGVSRSTIRKALLKLESENLVIIEENKSARVRRFSLEEALHYLEIRSLLEGLVIRQSLPFFGPAEIAEMQKALAAMKESLDARELLQYSQRNWQFHDVVYRVCPNRPAVEMIMEIKNLMKQCNIRTVLVPGRGEESFCEHGAILSALEKGDADEAERLMLRHMSGLKTVLQNNFDLLL
jgi:DNA-binding GntR family transcriptional regulator